ncbi:ATPase, T2SS/T4P/T4SS family [Burkholderia cenocepacia]|uniref:ATPase, T2SS/T4P/T4SS family n=1 Tax=Burkholderia cenocepacia TaxID=95486 RepID=UPI000760E1F3|nr:ATPase, T2SS/T4P/T4SS family [Burkholderia cenocepacia]KWU26340.1 hypothetical protein AS149_25460 [Burkholderia cenocepacia]
MTDDFKSQAARLGAHLASKHGIKLKKSNLLEAIAAVHSARDWNTLHARAENQSDAQPLPSSAPGGVVTFATGDDGRLWLEERLHRVGADFFHLVPCATGWKLFERTPSGERVQLATLDCPQGTSLSEYFLSQAGLSFPATEPLTGQFVSTRLVGDARQELRYSVATVPTVHGQALVLRAHPRSRVLSVRDLGLSAGAAWLEGVAHGPRLTVVTGPTAAGKTTTLRATARTLATMGRTVCLVSENAEELEDVFVMGLCSVASSKGATTRSLERTLGAVERFAPDHILIDDEPRDPAAAMQVAALLQKGFRVTLATHAYSSHSVVRRLAEFGLNPGSLQQSVGVLCQELLQAAPAGHVGSPPRLVASNFFVTSPQMEPHLDDCVATDTVSDAVRMLESGAITMSSFVRCYGNHGVERLPEHLRSQAS